MQDFAGEIRATMDVENFLNQAQLMLNMSKFEFFFKYIYSHTLYLYISTSSTFSSMLISDCMAYYQANFEGENTTVKTRSKVSKSLNFVYLLSSVLLFLFSMS